MKENIVKKIKLSNCSEYALVDNEDYASLRGYTWRKNAQGYAVRREYTRVSKGVRHAKDVRMHRQIMGEPEGKEVDHENGKGLDNQKNNLRIATHGQNMFNKTKQINNTSGYKGVSWSKQNKKWYAWIGFKGKTLSIGHFDNILEAAKAYNQKAIELHGEFARLNLL